MAVYKCLICGHIYDEEKEGILFNDLPDNWVCPTCTAPKSMFRKVEEKQTDNKQLSKKESDKETEQEIVENKLENYLKSYQRENDDLEKWMDDVHEMAITGKSIIKPMGTKLSIVNWDDILILGAQLATMPLEKDEEVTTRTIIGKKAKKPMVIENPVFVSHMSFGALSKEAKESLAIGSSRAKTAIASGEGGILKEEIDNAYKYIFEYVPNKYSVTDENLKRVDAIEIKIGQGTKPGMGGHLPGDKVTEEIALVRGKKVGEDVISPSKFAEINNKEDLKNLVSNLRERSGGRPIGIKLAAGHIEEDICFAAYSNPDFITIDGRGGATGASPKVVRDATSVPTIYALYRARKYLDENNLDIDLIITGGLRITSDFAKAIAMGADAVAIATSAMMAAACQQYRICQNGMCPVGVATQDESLRKRIKVEQSAKRVENFFNCVNEELKTFARITGHKDIHDLTVKDLCTISSEIEKHTNISHA